MPKAFTPAEQQAHIERPTRLIKQCPRCRVVKTWKDVQSHRVEDREVLKAVPEGVQRSAPRSNALEF